ncbi:MAG: hypothetical protein LAT80_13185 [Balneolaceae bacterium]|nr:hypothetical protein [Balneolaceae bacterium]
MGNVSHDTLHHTPNVDQLVSVLNGDMHRGQILDKQVLKDRKKFRDNYFNPVFDPNLSLIFAEP